MLIVLTALRQRRYLALLTICLVAAGCCLLAASWQWDRYVDKVEANQLLQGNAAQQSVPVSRLLTPGQPVDRAERLRMVTATGEYEVSGQVYVRNRQVDEQLGYLVVTPLRTTAGPTLLVVRGWTPAGGSADQTPEVPPPPQGRVTVTGRLYPSEGGGIRQGLPDAQVDRIDVSALAELLGTDVHGGYVELVTQSPKSSAASDALDPLRPLPEPDLANPAGGAGEGQHLAYVAQWVIFGGLALAAPFLLIWLDTRPRPPLDRSTQTDRGPRAATGG